MTAKLKRCAWAEGSDLMRAYHDEEWGVPSRDERYLFEFLTLEGAQAGLSWSTVLNKRARYREVLDDFEPTVVAGYDADRLDSLLLDPGIIRHRGKVASLVTNAEAFLAVRAEFGSFATYLWGWVDGRPIVNAPPSGVALPATTELSDRLSKDLKKRGFKFVGSTIVYSYLQAVGVVDDHVEGCNTRALVG
ncbi:DNA-3-methyladenine glycosylase I [Jatrophihabitans sp. GAS493]|uniref:DNA-3-methyladenine glycosylase I n=1 Tax=Jatrophihabitans sp. GAS493 TaxID=1907575 RepID=UPI000BB8E988|nr:DNA-3-methyladenine glycosylase I [Jatrophihabitans sp. GAS493]SOD71492.1 DNA-3-methyladenine glycosylase I [Jatrophihabitans sp. GAS493]